ncbi:hypothetical protein RhiirA4_549373 [Rhizophagus irregularis]|uniref:Serine-threonine/tyrosine-protein kinase catalytic domain-containing protein n=1 Tax=Rhizophagus irregularis TaxID=588596 RepID=A0A2I1HCW8_9GLOM|nr:hypothetical protein RhiirA4_549373 [Rhizophagus irregularis]
MKSCWNPDPKKRPSISEIYLTIYNWDDKGKNKEEFVQADAKRVKLIESKKIGPEFAEKCHPKAIYTSRPLSDLISKCLSINSFSTISFGNKQDYNYISKEEELDIIIDIESLSSKNLTIQNSNSLKKRNIEELNLETYDDSGSSVFGLGILKRNETSSNVSFKFLGSVSDVQLGIWRFFKSFWTLQDACLAKTEMDNEAYG